jgi:Putative DNA-binding domain
MGRAEEIFQKLRTGSESAIDEFILTRQAEELYLDFKRSADNGRGPRVLHANDRDNLAKAISGFGNSEGGVIVWGVDASIDVDYADVARAKVPIENIARFKSWLEGSVSGRTVPAHSGVQNHAIDVGDGKGFVATLIPKSELAPHQSVSDYKYYMRAGSSFLPVPHAVLAGMFGRRPQPTIFQTFASGPARILIASDKTIEVECNVAFQIYNKGPVLARDLYSDLRLILPKSRCGASFQPNDSDWIGRMNFGIWLSQVSKADFRLGPESFTQLFIMHLIMGPPFSNGKFWFKWTFGCEGSAVNLMEVEQSLVEVERLYQEFVTGPQEASDGHRFVNKLFKMAVKEERNI